MFITLAAIFTGAFLAGIALGILKWNIQDKTTYEVFKEGRFYTVSKYTFKENIVDILLGICGVIGVLSFIIMMIIL